MRFLSNTMLQSLDIPVPVDCHCCGSPLLELDPFIPSPRTVYMFGITIVVTCHTCSPRIRDGRLITSHIVRKTGQTNGRMYTAYDGNWNGFVVDDGTYEFNNEDETVLLVVDATQSGMQHFSVKLLEDATFCKP